MSDRLSRSLDKLMASVAPLFDANEFALAKATLVDACKATRRVRAGKDKATGAYLYSDEPDFPTRCAAAVKIVEWTVGKPVARSVSANLTPNQPPANEGDFLCDAMRDPEALRSMHETFQKMIAAAEKARPVDVTAKPVQTDKNAGASAATAGPRNG